MLDNITKKNIDNCRDVLVGKVPDPKSQIEQITLALIYKFMDDMDKESIDLGGMPKFFTGDYEKFGWRKLFDPSLGGKEVLDLYSEALDVLQTNANLPELFRNIFKNAYLPYRDPSTLKMFLKYINEFEYSHSEKLGDAFEYLLSVMGSQGDAGQFRTPRHVIDFIAACLNPQKHETVADPACGTAGFLLSAYKHILQNNTDKRLGDKLTPDDRKKLAENFYGYDISPDMVRLSLVNMYLHGFTTPKIFEYDTLSSEDRWNETFDVIAANPPFMTPKGGIRPHKKFGVQANKAEVLFTDYIAEHLTKNGRAGIVVPNGIIATTQTAYKQLRKMLVDDSLIAVVSLPAGCFMPYSGVKTSILMLDKPLAKKTNHVLFIKVSNDGYDLGAQRREHDKNDLPLALDAFNSYKESISFGKTFDLEKYSSICALVEKEKITDNKDITLSSERYVEGKVSQTEFELFKLGEICDVRDGTHDSPKYVLDGFPLVTSKNIINGKIDFTNVNLISKDDLDKVNKRSYVDDGDLIMPMIGTIGNPIIVKKDREFGIKNVALIKPKENSRINNVYLKYMLGSETINEHFINEAKGVAQKYLSLGFLRDLEIPLPPLEIQEQIVKEIECYQKIIDGAKMVVDNYKPTISIKPEWEMIELGNVCEVNPKKSEVKILEDSTLVSFVPMADLNENEIAFIPKDKKPISEVIGGYTYFKDNDVLVAKVTPCFENGKAGIAKSLENGIGFGSSEFFVLRASDAILPEWIYLNIKSDKFVNDGKKQMSGTSGLQRLPREFVASFPICLPSIEEQQYFIEKMRIEQQIIDSNKLLITLFEQKIKDKINEVWGVKEEVV
jgi:type I restriction enzyme M protein